MRHILSITFMLFALASPNSYSEELNARFKKVVSDTGETPPGLTPAMIQDSLGFIWLGGSEGLRRYDGHRFRSYSLTDVAFSSAYVTSMINDSKGDIWVATTNSLHSINPKTLEKTLFLPSDSAKSNGENLANITSIATDKHGVIFIGSKSGVYSISHDRKTFKSLDVPTESVMSIKADLFDNLWVVYENADIIYYERRTGSVTRYTLSESSIDNTCRGTPLNIYITREQEIYLGTLGGGLCRYDQREGSFKSVAPSLNIHTVWHIAEDSTGAIWAATDGDGLLRTKNSISSLVKRKKSKSDSIGSNQLRAVLVDRRGDIWVSLFPEGVQLMDRSLDAIKTYVSSGTEGLALPHEAIVSLESDSSNIWIGTEDGLSVLDTLTGEIKRIIVPRKLKTNGHNRDTILSLKKYGKYMLVGTWSNSLLVLNTETANWQTFAEFSGVNQTKMDQYIWAIETTPKGEIWYGTETGGAVKYSPGTNSIKRFEHSASSNSIPSNFVRSILIDREERVWLGTNDGMAVIAKEDSVVRYPPNSHHLSFFGTRIMSMYQDDEGTIWIGTQDGGLSTLNTRTYWFETKTTHDGLPSNSVSSVTQDANSDIWVGTTDGVAILDKKGDIKKLIRSNQGLLGNTINRNTLARDNTNTIWVGTTSGLSSIKTNKLESVQSNGELPVFVTDIYVNDTYLDRAHIQGDIPYNKNTIQFHFTSLSYRNSDSFKYEYRLIGGANESWQSVNEPVVTFPNLKSGRYVFEASAVYDNGLRKVSEPYIFEVSPPWYASHASFLIYAGIFCLAVYGIYLYQIKHIQLASQIRTNEKMISLDKAKDTFLANTSHELRTPVAAMVGIAETLEDQGDQAGIRTIISTGKRLLLLINDILDYSKMMHGDVVLNMISIPLRGLVDEVYEILHLQASDKVVNLINDVDDTILVKADSNRLTQILINIVTNAIKYSNGTTVRTYINDSLQTGPSIEIEDDGVGIPESKQSRLFEPFIQSDISSTEHATGTGLGLTITKMLTNAQGGEISITSTPGSGTCFSIRGLKVFKLTRMPDQTDQPSEEGKADLIDYSKYTILVVDDDPTNRMIVRSILEKKGFNVDEAKGGIDALKQISTSTNTPDLLLMDMHMPCMNGFETERAIRSELRGIEIPTLFLSAAKISPSHATRNGHDIADFFLKPINKENVVARIEFYLKRRIQHK